MKFGIGGHFQLPSLFDQRDKRPARPGEPAATPRPPSAGQPPQAHLRHAGSTMRGQLLRMFERSSLAPFKAGARPAPARPKAPSLPPRPAASQPDVDMERLFANARTYLTADEFNQVATGKIDLMDLRDVIDQRVELNAPGGDFLPAYTAPAQRQPATPPPPAPPSAASEPDVDMERLFANARAYLTAEEFNQVATGKIDLMDMRDVIDQRVELNAPGGDFLPAYTAPAQRQPATPPHRPAASEPDVDMERLFANARAYLTAEEFNQVATGKIDLMDMRDVIDQRVELNAPRGDFLPAYR